jgi:hypothetical protein
VHWLKWVGVAGFVGVAATGVVLARAERRQRDYSPEEIRERLHARAAEALDGGAARDSEDGAATVAPPA